MAGQSHPPSEEQNGENAAREKLRYGVFSRYVSQSDETHHLPLPQKLPAS